MCTYYLVLAGVVQSAELLVCADGANGLGIDGRC